MQTLSVSEFKAKALGLVEHIAQTGEPLIVTKRGKAIVKVIPFSENAEGNVPGKLKGSVLEEVDIISPIGEDIWNAAQ